MTSYWTYSVKRNIILNFVEVHDFSTNIAYVRVNRMQLFCGYIGVKRNPDNQVYLSPDTTPPSPDPLSTILTSTRSSAASCTIAVHVPVLPKWALLPNASQTFTSLTLTARFVLTSCIMKNTVKLYSPLTGANRENKELNHFTKTKPVTREKNLLWN